MDAFTDRLSDYLDDEGLSAEERRAIAAHLAGCVECRQTLADLQSIVAQAQALPNTPPETDLWPGVADRIQSRRVVDFPARPVRRFSFTLPQLVAAGLALMVTSGGFVWLAQLGGPATAPPPVAAVSSPDLTPVNLTDARYDEAVADLERALELGRGRLDPETVRVLEANLQSIDQAIDQCRRALSEDPANAYLTTHLANSRQRKLALLRRATSLLSNES
jgi:tetratricopeptide (TPR) repeat protein